MTDDGPVLRLERSTLRPWRTTDTGALVHHADDREVWRNMRDDHPPRTWEEALRWLGQVVGRRPARDLAIEREGEAVGGIGLARLPDVLGRGTEIGFWLGRTYWNHGIVTEAVQALTAHAFTTLDLVRVEARVFAWNTRSMRVLEKCGYEREGLQRKAIFKDGCFTDCVLFAKLRPDMLLPER